MDMACQMEHMSLDFNICHTIVLLLNPDILHLLFVRGIYCGRVRMLYLTPSYLG
jgi:hypothetical protein